MIRGKTEATSVSTALASVSYPEGPMTQPSSVPAAAAAPAAPAAAPAAAGQGKRTEAEVWLVEVAKGSGGGAKSNRELLSIAIREGRGADVSYKLVHVITEVPCQLGTNMAVSQVDKRVVKAYETQLFSSLISPLVSLAASKKVQVRYVPMKKNKREDGLTEAAERVSARRLYVLGRQKEVEKLALGMPGGCSVVGVSGGKVVAEAMAPQIDVFDSLDPSRGPGDSGSACGHVEIEYYDSLSEHSLNPPTSTSERSTASSPRNNLLSPSVASTSTSTAAAATSAADGAGAVSDHSFHSLPRANTFHASDASAVAAIAEATATPDSTISSSCSNFHAMSLQRSPLLLLQQPKGSSVAERGQQLEHQHDQKGSPHWDSQCHPDQRQPHQLLQQRHQHQPRQHLEHRQQQQQHQQRSTRSPLSKSSSAILVSSHLEDLAHSVSGAGSCRLEFPKSPAPNPNPRGTGEGTALETDCLSSSSATSLKQKPSGTMESDPGQPCSSARDADAEGQGPGNHLALDSHYLTRNAYASTGPPSNPAPQAALEGRPHTANSQRAQHNLLSGTTQQPSHNISAYSAASHFEFTLESGSGHVPLPSASPTWWGTETEKGVGQSGAGPVPTPLREDGHKSQGGSLGLSSSWKGFRKLLKSRKGV